MATRLYPSTTTSILEILAGVPIGTAQRFHELESRYSNLHGESPEDTSDYTLFWNSMDEVLHTWHNFTLFGWTRLTDAAAYLLESYGLDPVEGSISGDRALIEGLLFAQGIPNPSSVARMVDGVYWA